MVLVRRCFFGPAGTALTGSALGGSGWFGTVGIGYDWQFNGRWVAGVFADGQFGDIRGSLSDPVLRIEGPRSSRPYAAGVRLGYLVAPNVLSYVNGGYSGSEWSARICLPCLQAAVRLSPPQAPSSVMAGSLVAASRTISTFSASLHRLVHENRISVGVL
jgi:outer membrane immunogenic protein